VTGLQLGLHTAVTVESALNSAKPRASASLHGAAPDAFCILHCAAPRSWLTPTVPNSERAKLIDTMAKKEKDGKIVKVGASRRDRGPLLRVVVQ
jgi:hypothetical protein